MPPLPSWALGGLLVAFAVTQCGYLLANAVAWTAIYPRSKRRPSTDTPEDHPPVDVLLPLYRERRAVLEETLDCVRGADYPLDRVTVYLVYEEDDPVVTEYVPDVVDGEDLAVEGVPIWKDDPVWEHVSGAWGAGYLLSRNKARALDYALYALTLDESHVLTVLDSDTKFAPTLFDRGVAGLAEFDIVQAKQTVRNVDDGWLPLLESTGIAAWCDLIYERTTVGPYQLLGKGYFADVDTVMDLHGWDPDATTEDLSLGVAAHVAGYDLGTLDVYVEDLCPAPARDWVRQKRRWVTGPYRSLTAPGLTLRERARFTAFTLVSQFVTLLNLVGVPVGLAFLVLTLLGGAPALGGWLRVVVLLNLVSWVHYSAASLLVADEAMTFEGPRERVSYFLRSNPVTQLVYATLWVVPVLLALWDCARGADAEFVVTPK